ncbi:MAG: hypothetical protein EYC70_15860 [Planctomycetota bacterium]|nr:MAG: hypothetical protein EYC70_15860 [Planctomycetota bacterium]
MSISTVATLALLALLAGPESSALGAAAPCVAAQQELYTVSGDSALDAFGSALAGVGDVDGDGTTDFCVGAPGDDDAGENAGSLSVYSGASGALLHHLPGDAARNQLGIWTAPAGDVNADGVPDYLACAAFDNPFFYPSGYVRVYSGAGGAVLHTFQSDNNFDAFGRRAAGAGDVDRDGHDDVIVGAPEDSFGGSSAGAAYVYSGRTGERLHILRGEDSWDWFGWSVAGLGDVSGDGYGDFAVGIRLDDGAARDAGAVRVCSGRTGAPLYTVHGAEEADQLGFALAATADTDGDGRADFIATGMDDLSNNLVRAGFGRLYSGVNGALLRSFDRDSGTEGFGTAAAGPGDVDGDGADDVLLSAPYFGDAFATGVNSGAVRVFSGRSGRLLFQVPGSANLQYLGTAVGAVGDLDGDGNADFAVGIPGLGDGGAVRVYLSPRVTRLIVPDLVAGQPVTVRTEGGRPGDLVTFNYSLAGWGVTPVFGTSVALDLAAPVSVAGTAAADAGGTALLTGFVPNSVRGLTLYVQAYEAIFNVGWGVTTSAARTVQ